jgi:Fibronectin type III domain
LPRSSDRAATDQRMAAVHALGHPNSPASQTAWEPPELAQGGGSTAPGVTAAPVALPPNAPSLPVLAQGTGSDLMVTWTAPAVDPAHGAATGFALRHSAAGAETWTVVQAVSNPYELSDLPSAVAVEVQLQAANASGLSMWSATATLTTGVTSSLPTTSGPLSRTPATPVRRMLSARRCRMALLNQLLCRFSRQFRTYLWRDAYSLHLRCARRRERQNR